MNIPFLPLRPRVHLFPSPIFWLKALFLLPLAMPLVRVFVSGFSWLSWLSFPFSWLAAAAIIGVFHVLLPIAILAGVYWGVRSMWSAKSSISQMLWFACSTMAIVILSFCGTLVLSAAAELTICHFPTATILVGGSCSNHFLNTDVADLLTSMETYNFRFYTWILWWMLIAYMYQLEAYLWEHSIPKIEAFDTYQQEDEESLHSTERFVSEDLSLDQIRPISDADVLDGPAHL
jgi:hypothetical protein